MIAGSRVVRNETGQVGTIVDVTDHDTLSVVMDGEPGAWQWHPSHFSDLSEWTEDLLAFFWH